MGQTLSNQSFYALVIVAHPDDETFLFAGTTLKFEEEGKTVGVICATHGEKGADRLNRRLTEEQMATIRTRELQTACNILGCDCKKLFDYHDGALDKENFDQLVEHLKTEISTLQPQIVLTFGKEGISGHKDHISVGKAALEASKQSQPKPSEVWLASIPASLIENFTEHMEKRKIHHLHFIKNTLKGVDDDKLIKIDISKYKKQKLQALKAHQSQYLLNLVWPHFLEYECFEVAKLLKEKG